MSEVKHHTGTLKLVTQKEEQTAEDWCTENCLNELQTHEFLSKRESFNRFGNKFILLFGKVYYIINHKSTTHYNAIMVEDMVAVEKNKDGGFCFSVLLHEGEFSLSRAIEKELNY